MKNRLSFSKLVEDGAIKFAAPRTQTNPAAGTTVTLVDGSGRLTASGRASLSQFLQQAKTDQEAIALLENLLAKNKIKSEVIGNVSANLKGMLTGPNSLFGQIIFASPQDRSDALQTLLSPTAPRKSFALSTRRPVEQTGHTNVRLQAAASSGIIAPAYVRGNVLYTGATDPGMSSTTDKTTTPVNVYKGDLSQLIVDLLEGAKSNPQEAKQEAQKDTQSTINKIKSDPKLSDQQKQGLIQQLINTVSQFFSRLFGGGKGPQAGTPSAPKTQSAPTVKTLGLVITNRLYKSAARLGQTPLQSAISMYLKGVRDTLGRRADPSKVEVLLGPTQEVAGTLDDIFSKGISLSGSSATKSGDINFEVGLRHPLFKLIPDLGTLRAVARKVQESYPEAILSYQEDKDGDTVKMTFTADSQSMVSKEPAAPRAPGYSPETGTSRGVASQEVHGLYTRLMKFLPAVKARLLTMKDENTSKLLRIVSAFEVYDALYAHIYSGEKKGLMGQEIADALHLLADGLSASSSPEDLLGELTVQASLLEKVPGMAKLLAKVPSREDLSSFNPQDTAKDISSEGQKTMGLPDEKIVINPRRYGPGSYDKKISDLAAYIKSLKERFPKNQTLAKAIAEVEGRVRSSATGEDKLTSAEIKKIEQLLQKLAF